MENIIENVLSSLIYLTILLILILGLIYISERKRMGKQNKDPKIITIKAIISGMISRFVKDTIETEIYNLDEEKVYRSSEEGKRKNKDNQIKGFLNANENSEVYYRSSKDYGENPDFSVRTWFGLNIEKTKKSFDYICFNIKSVEKIFFKPEDFLKLIQDTLVEEQYKKYEEKGSLDIYLMKSKEDSNWYITRLGDHLKDYIKIVLNEKDTVK